MRYPLEPFLRVVDHRPLTVVFGIHNPAEAPRARRVPVLLTPLGYFVRMRLTDEHGDVVWKTLRPKIHLKLDPARAEGYRDLDPGYLHGVLFDLSRAEPGPGPHTLEVKYSNGQFDGTVEDPIGALDFTLELALPAAER